MERYDVEWGVGVIVECFFCVLARSYGLVSSTSVRGFANNQTISFQCFVTRTRQPVHKNSRVLSYALLVTHFEYQMSKSG